MYVAAHGWDHAAWSGSFYPADLPPEWRLSYYANEFRAVVVPAAVWQQANEANAMQWRADTTAGFSMLLAAAKTPPEPRLLTALGDRFAGMVGDGGLAQASWTGGADARAIRAAIESLAEPGVLLVDGKPPSIEALRTAQILAQLLGRG